MIEGKKNQYVASLGDMSGFLTSLISLFTANEGQISNEIKELSKYKKVDNGGNLTNNIGYQVTDKIKFLNWMYKDSDIYLQRKYDRYCKYYNINNSLSA